MSHTVRIIIERSRKNQNHNFDFGPWVRILFSIAYVIVMLHFSDDYGRVSQKIPLSKFIQKTKTVHYLVEQRKGNLKKLQTTNKQQFHFNSLFFFCYRVIGNLCLFLRFQYFSTSTVCSSN